MGILVEEEWVNATENFRCGNSGVYEAWFETPGQAFREFSRIHGRCISSIYVDRAGKAVRVGWVFQKKAKYEDTGEPYLRETWVTMHRSKPTRTVKEHFLELESR